MGWAMLPKPGVRAEQIKTQIADLLTAGGNLLSDDVVRYVGWVHSVERCICEIFTEVPLDRLYTERFWQLNKGPAPTQWAEMVGLERDRQREWLEVLLDRVTERTLHFGDGIS